MESEGAREGVRKRAGLVGVFVHVSKLSVAHTALWVHCDRLCVQLRRLLSPVSRVTGHVIAVTCHPATPSLLCILPHQPNSLRALVWQREVLEKQLVPCVLVERAPIARTRAYMYLGQGLICT
eukprot:699495-Rhodomonas_salina.2